MEKIIKANFDCDDAVPEHATAQFKEAFPSLSGERLVGYFHGYALVLF